MAKEQPKKEDKGAEPKTEVKTEIKVEIPKEDDKPALTVEHEEPESAGEEKQTMAAFQAFLLSNPAALKAAIKLATEQGLVPAQTKGPQNNPTPKNKPAEVEVDDDATPIEAHDKMINVVPRTTTESIRIGLKYYQFTKGKAQRIPWAIRSWLLEKGII